MKNIICFCFVAIFLACGVHNKQILVFEPVKGGVSFTFKIPDGYEERRYSGDNKHQQEYWFKDSSVFYLTTFRNTYNYEEIREQGTYYDRFEALNFGDTITLSGNDKKGLNWKDKLIGGGVTVGYSRVPSERLEAFENAVLSVRKKK
jgi:hypothetical protein